LQILCPGWPQTSILSISASQVARITDVSHRRLASASEVLEVVSLLGACGAVPTILNHPAQRGP
jgi:hypothetical protein